MSFCDNELVSVLELGGVDQLPERDADQPFTAAVYSASCGKLDPSRWAEVTRLFDDANIYQTHEYGTACWNRHELHHLILWKNERMVAAAQVRVMKVPLIRCGVAYVRYGPLVRLRGAPYDPEIMREMTRALVKEFVDRRGLMLRMIPNLMKGDPDGEMTVGIWNRMGLRLQPEVYVSDTIVVDLGPSIDELRMGLRQRWRNILKHSENSDYVVRTGTSDELFAVFEKLFDEMMDRKRFDTTVDVREHREIQRLLDESSKMHILICEKDGKPQNGLVFSTMGNGAIYLLGATGNEGLAGKGAYLLIWRSLIMAKELGCAWFDLGGIHPEKNPGGYQFKGGMGGREVSLIGAYELSRNWMNPAALKLGEWLRAGMRWLRR
jgi:peptidoglycan pentaglycine glycine transferase (the first glycine)